MPIRKAVDLNAAFAAEQKCLHANLSSSGRITHQGDKGEVNEQFFIEVLRSYLPDRYTVDKAIVVDSKGSVSDSIDVVVFDRQYTPTLFDNNKHRYVPAEAVYAVFECKPTVNRDLLIYAGEKAASVRKLYRTSVPITHLQGISKPKPPPPILGGILSVNFSYKRSDNSNIASVLSGLPAEQRLDCGFSASGVYFDKFDNKLFVNRSSTAIAFFVFRVLKRLRDSATAPAADWDAYSRSLS